MATIRKRGDRQWEVRVRRKGWPVQCQTFETRARAEGWGRQIEAEMDRGSFVPTALSDRTTLGEALERYASEITSAKKGAVQEQCRIAHWKCHPFAARAMSSIRGHDVAAYRDARLKTVSPSTVRLELALLSHVFTIARKEWGFGGLINPVQDVRLPAKSRERDRRLAAGEEERLLSAAAMYRELPEIIILALETAMRRSELMGLAWGQVDLRKRIAHLVDSKNGSARLVPLSSRALSVLSRRPRHIDGRVFTLSMNFVTVGFTRACKRADIKGLRFHDLRHEAVSRLFEKGLNPMQVATISGHKTLQMLKRYTHLRAEDLVTLLG